MTLGSCWGQRGSILLASAELQPGRLAEDMKSCQQGHHCSSYHQASHLPQGLDLGHGSYSVACPADAAAPESKTPSYCLASLRCLLERAREWSSAGDGVQWGWSRCAQETFPVQT